MDFEPAEDQGCAQLGSSKNPGFVHNAVMPNGKSIPLLKTLLTSACERDCYYCPFRAGRDFRRTTLKPAELAHIFMAMHRAGIVEGLFLSSGIAGGGIRTQDKLIDTANILRSKHHFRGYLHLKIMPGADKDQVRQAMQLANRVSLNLEAPNSERLTILAPHKAFKEELLQPLIWVEEIRNSKHRVSQRKPSLATQFVVGGAEESDLELLSTTDYLYRKLGLQRAYYSPFRPVENTPLENKSPTNLQRESRLYQASFLIRDYGFSVEELPFDQEGNLPQNSDPKLSWAKANLNGRPIELNIASKHQLLRIPGIGPRSANAILAIRKQAKINNLEQLRRIGVNPSKALPYILLNGRQPSYQIALL